MSLIDRVKTRGIAEVLHFTTNRGLVGILATGVVKSRRRLTSDNYLKNILHPNSMIRPEEAVFFDKSEDWLDFVNLSISAINTRFMGFSNGWSHNKDRWWSILSFDAELIGHSGAYFASTNNGYPLCTRSSGTDGFDRLFDAVIPRKGSWRAFRGARPDHLPTCEQAELLYPGEVPVRFLRKIYVREGVDRDRARAWVKEFGHDGIDVILDPSAFVGFPN